MPRKLTKEEQASVDVQFTPLSGEKRSKKEAFFETLKERRGYVIAILLVIVGIIAVIAAEKNTAPDMKILVVMRDGHITEELAENLTQALKFYVPDTNEDGIGAPQVTAGYHNPDNENPTATEKRQNETFFEALDDPEIKIVICDPKIAEYLFENDMTENIKDDYQAILLKNTDFFATKNYVGMDLREKELESIMGEFLVISLKKDPNPVVEKNAASFVDTLLEGASDNVLYQFVLTY